MTSMLWQVDQQEACLRLGCVAAKLLVGRADRGLLDVRAGDGEIRGAELLGLGLPSLAQGEVANRVECYARGRDLIAAFAESAVWPVCVGIVWRAVGPTGAPGVATAVDMIVSVRTAMLDSWPELAVRSRLPSSPVLRLADAHTGRFEPCGDASSLGAAIGPGSGPSCLLFRVPDSPVSYAEMVHPGDFQGTTLAPATDGPTVAEVRHRLFAERLEKGVILRARVRGAIVQRADDLASAWACYRAFAAADPPLGA